MSKTLQQKYHRIADQYIKVFCKKHEVTFESWVTEETRDIALIADCFLNLSDIRLDIDKDVPINTIFEWCDECLQLGQKGENTKTYYQFLYQKEESSKPLFLRKLEKKNKVKKIKESLAELNAAIDSYVLENQGKNEDIQV